MTVQLIRISSTIFTFTLLTSLLFVAQNSAAIRSAQAQNNVLTITEFMASNSNTLADEDGDFSDWIEIYNGGSSAINLQGFTLSDNVTVLDKWTFPNIVLNADQYLVLFASNKDRVIEGNELHTNFKLSASGEYLALSDSSGTIRSEFATAYPRQYENVSFGVDAGDNLRYFNTPTAGGANGGGVYPYAASAPTSSAIRGFYTAAPSVALSAQPGAQIYYTVDGSEPSISNGNLYSGPLYVDGITTLRAISILNGTNPSSIATFSYIFHDNVVDQGDPTGWPTGTVNNQFLNYGMDPNVVDVERYATKLALTELPSISLVMDPSNLLDPATGIYVNASEGGSEWERSTSVEWLNADNSDGFQIDAGIRIRGGYSRRGDNPKHSFHLYFNNDYDGTLEYPIFGSEGVDTFKRIDLRTPQNYAWSASGHPHNTFLREIWSRDTQAAMGAPHTRSNYLHLYINGQYWGIYMTQERVSQQYAADYFGGNEDDYDVIKHFKGKGVNPDRTLNGRYNVSQGNDAEWQELWQLIADQVVTDAEYEQIAAAVEIDSLIDVHLIQFYTADYDSYRMFWWDWKRANNWFALRNRTGDGLKWHFFMHDAEHSLGAYNHNATEERVGPLPVMADNEYYSLAYFNPGWIHQALMSNSQYLAAFQYRAWKHLKSENGVLTPAAARARWDNRKAQIEAALLAESARWGDTFVEPPRGAADWQNEVSWVENNWFPNRSDRVLTQLQSYNLATTTQPPEPAAPTYPTAKLILNEYNGVVSDQFLQEGGSDTFFGQVAGNGGDWFELVVVEDQLDIRGWTVELWDADNFSGARYRTDLLKFADQLLLANLRRGTIVTISEDLADNISYDPAGGDWWINLQANSEHNGAFFTPVSQSNFDTNSKEWQLVIRDAAGNVVFGPAGEGTGNFLSGLGNAEVGKLEENPQSTISPTSVYQDGTTSTFGAPNIWGNGAFSQDFTVLRSVVPANTPTSTPTSTLTSTPTNTPTSTPTLRPTNIPTNVPTSPPTSIPTDTPALTPQITNTPEPTYTPIPSATQPATPVATQPPTSMPPSTPITISINTPTAVSTVVPTEAANVATIAATITATATIVSTAQPTNTPRLIPTDITSVATAVNTVEPTSQPISTLVPNSTLEPTSTLEPSSTAQPNSTATQVATTAATAIDIPPASSTPVDTPVMTVIATATAPNIGTTAPENMPIPDSTTTPESSATEIATPEPGTLSIDARLQGDQVSVLWTFTADRKTVWFYVHRSLTPDFGTAEQITADFIPSHFSGTTSYEFTDPVADNDETYYYWVEQVYGSDDSKLHGPTSLFVEGKGSVNAFIYLPLVR